MGDSSSRPTGRDEVVEAVLDAAGRLFARRGPTAVSLRDVAIEADVNVGLIHRHIGTKSDLVAAVLRRPAFRDGVGARFPDTTLADFIRAIVSADLDADVEHFSRIQARAILDGYDLVDLGVEFQALRFAVDVLDDRLPRRDAEIRAAVLGAFVTGWRTLGPAYLHAVGIDDVGIDELDRVLGPLVDALTSG